MAPAHDLAREVAQLRRELAAREAELEAKDEALAEKDAVLRNLYTHAIDMLMRHKQENGELQTWLRNTMMKLQEVRDNLT